MSLTLITNNVIALSTIGYDKLAEGAPKWSTTGQLSAIKFFGDGSSLTGISAGGVDTGVRALSANWQNTYTTVNANSATWGSGGGSGTDTEVRTLTSKYESVYSNVQSNSATNWNYQGTDLKGLSANWQNTYTTVQTNSATNWFTDGGNSKGSNLTLGTNDNFALNLETNGSNRVIITNAGNVGIGTTSPAQRLSVSGDLSASGTTSFGGSVTETKAEPTISSGTLTLNLAAATFFIVNLNADITTITLQNTPQSPRVYSFTLQLSGNSPARTVEWPTSFRWSGNTAPTLTTSTTAVDTFTFVTHNGGTNWFAFISEQNQ